MPGILIYGRVRCVKIVKVCLGLWTGGDIIKKRLVGDTFEHLARRAERKGIWSNGGDSESGVNWERTVVVHSRRRAQRVIDETDRENRYDNPILPEMETPPRSNSQPGE